MNYKDVWDPVGKFFYTANFSLLISGLIVWDSSLIDLIPRVINLELHSILIFLGVLMLLVYFIIDWLDANIVALIDNETILNKTEEDMQRLLDGVFETVFKAFENILNPDLNVIKK